MGCGITAFDEEDAFSLIRKVCATPNVTFANVSADVQIQDLDRQHVLPNVGNHFQRGVWFPNFSGEC